MHVQTADERILRKHRLPTDVGMTGPHDSIIGVDIQAALGKLQTLPARFRPRPTTRRNAVIIEADEHRTRTDIETMGLARRSTSCEPPMTDLFDLPSKKNRAEREPVPSRSSHCLSDQ